jgi:hypothetical protein
MASAVAESLGRAGGDHYFAERCFGAIWVELILGRDSGAHLRELDSTERGHAGGSAVPDYVTAPTLDAFVYLYLLI